MSDENRTKRYERLALPHSSAAYNLARWLLGNAQDAEDVTQEAFLKAYQHLDSLRGEEALPWLLTIVRNECYDWLRRRRAKFCALSLHEMESDLVSEQMTPEEFVLDQISADKLRTAIEALPAEYREVIVLRGLEDLSYKQIADVINAPIGTAMSRLSRARLRLQALLSSEK